MDKLPDYLIENYIIPFLTSNELFYKIRPLSSYYYHCARVKILIKFPEEIMKSLKKIIEFNTREDPTTAFQELVQKSISLKRLLLIVNLQANPSLEINKILTNLRDERALRLIAFFYVLIKDEEKQNLIRQEKYDEIQELAKTEDAIKECNDKIKDSLNDEDLDFDLNEHKIVYSSLDHEFLRENQYTMHLNNFVCIFLEMEETKIQLNQAKNKLTLFLEQISETSEIWPKRKVFYEKTIELVADTQLLSNGAKNMIQLFKKYEIENDLDDFNYEKEIVTDFDINKNENNCYDKIKSNRKKLNATILRLHQLFSFFVKSAYLENKDDNICVDIFSIKKFVVHGMIFPIEEFLYILSMIKKKFCVNETTFLLTRNYLHHIIFHEIYNINPPSSVVEFKKIDAKVKDDKEDKNSVNGIKYISLLNQDIGDGINNFESVLASTESAGKEINESFIALSENLEKYSNRLHEQFNNNDI
jgi:hypothetical protein